MTSNLANFNKYNICWVLVDELALGPAPNSINFIETLKKNNIKNILTLCDKKEFNYALYDDYFKKQSYFIPDHRSSDKITLLEMNRILEILEEQISDAPTYVHCLYSIERSPLICLAYLIKYRKYPFQIALDYLMSIHPKTNPLDQQIELLHKI